jgi:hypothetical protein
VRGIFHCVYRAFVDAVVNFLVVVGLRFYPEGGGSTFLRSFCTFLPR